MAPPSRVITRSTTARHAEHPAARLHEHGADTLTDAELVALIAQPRGDAVRVARAWLARCGSLRELLDGNIDELLSLPGAGPVALARLRASRELVSRYLDAPLTRGRVFDQAAETRRYLELRLAGLRREVFACLFLDARHRLLGYEVLFKGTIDGASVHPREVVRRCLETNAAALIVAHNHPSGVAEPSAADRAITERLHQAVALIDVRLIDHVVVSDAGSVSFAERGWI